MKRKFATIITAILFTLLAAMLPGGAMQTARAANTQNWVYIGNPAFASSAEYISMQMYNGTPYVAYRDNNYLADGSATVMKYDTTNGWHTLGPAGITTGTVTSTSLAINEGMVYLAFSDSIYDNKVTVMQYVNYSNSWHTVGSPGFSSTSAKNVSMAIDDGTLYVAYLNDDSSFKATVMKYDEFFGWQTVGNEAFSVSSADRISFTVDNGMPYIAYMDLENSSKATVKKYDDTNGWQTVGDAGFSAGRIGMVSLAVDNGTPYAAYLNTDNLNKATVMKYDSTNGWAILGTSEISAGTVLNIALAVDDGSPYVVYSDIDEDCKAVAMKYNGTAWETVGNTDFAAGNATNFSLEFDSGTPYVAYGDNGDAATVVRLNNAPSGINLSDDSVPESEPGGTFVGAFSATDTDKYNSLTFSLVSGTGDDDNSAFVIDGTELKTTQVFDYETKSIYNICVQVADNGGLTCDETFTIKVINVSGDTNDNDIVVDLGFMPQGAVGSAFSYTPTITKGTAPYTWTASGLPSGLSINSSTGKISGVPTAVGISGASVTITDSLDSSFTFGVDIIIGYADLTISTANLAEATLGESYTCILAASGGDGNNNWYASGLPKGIGMGRDNGIISGTPCVTGTFSVDVRVYDGDGRKATKTYLLTVNSPSETAKYKIVPVSDSAYTVSTLDGFMTLTIQSGVSGFRYINVTLVPVVTHEGEETVIFVQKRNGIQIRYSFVKADFDAVSDAGAGFNVAPGDIILVYVVDELSNSADCNPVLFQ